MNMVTDDEVLAFDKADMRNPSVPSGFFSYSMLKAEILGLQAMIRTIWRRRTLSATAATQRALAAIHLVMLPGKCLRRWTTPLLKRLSCGR